MSWLLSLFGGGSAIRAYITAALIGALAITGIAIWMQTRRISAQAEEIGAHKAAYAALQVAYDDERRERLQDRAFAELNARMLTDALTEAQALAAKERIIERRIYVDRPIPVDVETACRPVLDAFNADLAGLRNLLGGDSGAVGGASAAR